MSQSRPAALFIVDVQRDFCSGGALAVPDGDRVVPVLNRCIDEAVRQGLTVYASRDWHPPASRHFRSAGGPWPPHCIQGTPGAEWHPDLTRPPGLVVISKGTEPQTDGYSAFEGVTPDARPLLADLRERGIRHLYVGGLATDYCVKHSVLDALAAGFEVTVLGDAVAGVDPAASAQALAQMQQRGARVAASAALQAGDGERPPGDSGASAGDR